MTTYDGVPSFGTFLAMKFVNRVSRAKASAKEGNRARTLMQAIVRLVLHLAGFSALTWAGFSWNMTAGLIVAGLSCFVLSWLMADSSTPTNDSRTGYDPMATRR